MSFSDEPKVYVSPYGYPYPMMPLGNGVVSTGEGMMAPTSLAPTTVWSGSGETSMHEGEEGGWEGRREGGWEGERER